MEQTRRNTINQGIDTSSIDVVDKNPITEAEIRSLARVDPQDAVNLYFQQQAEEREYGLN